MLQMHDKRWFGQFDWFKHKTRDNEYYQIIDIGKTLQIGDGELSKEEAEQKMAAEHHDEDASPVDIIFAQWLYSRREKFVHVNTMHGLCIYVSYFDKLI